MTSSARTPLLVVADDDPAERGLIEEELQRRYGADYTVRICATAELAEVLDAAAADGDDVALALAAGKEGAELLARMRGRFPTARRGVLIPWLGWSRRGVSELVLRGMARGWIDLYVIRPTRPSARRVRHSRCRRRPECSRPSIPSGRASGPASTPAKASVGVLGTGSGRTYSAIGDTVNVGSRIEGLAPPGGVAISAETARSLRAPRRNRSTPCT
ncbi:MAG: adenylate/guanylate cyclase domain-containing protein [Gaiellaceae bacterium]